MANFDISIIIPSDKSADFLAALRAFYGTGDDGQPRSNDELRNLVHADVMRRLRNIYKDYKQVSPDPLGDFTDLAALLGATSSASATWSGAEG